MTFTNQPPTEPGFFAWKSQGQSIQCGHFLVDEETGVLCDLETGLDPASIGGLWCRLVPAEEVEKAFREGHHYGYCCANHIDMDKRKDDWQNSRARRVATGEEVNE